MEPRERCLRAVLREEVDRIPLSIWIERPEPYGSLAARLGESDLERLLRRLQVDYRGFLPNISFLGIGLHGGFKPGWVEVNGRKLWRDSWGVLHATSSDGRTSMHVIHPLESMDVREYPFPEAREEDFAVVEKFRKEHENHCVIAFAFQPFETACALFGYNAIYRAMLREPWKVEFVLDKLFALAEQLAALVADAGVDQVYSGDDTGAQTTMLISPQLWRRFLKPRYERLAHTIHKRGAFFHFHSDGWIEPIIPDIIEAGVDVLEPIQPECMDIKKVKELYGDRLSFEGGLGVQRLPFLSVEEVVREVGWLIENLGPTGYTLRPSHTILPETPVENIIAVYDAAARYARRVSSP